jgi:hypothetical protein
MRYEEKVAKRVLEMAVPGARMVFRSEQSHGEYDFDLQYPNGEVAAVEVTSSRDHARTQISKEVFEKNGGSRIQAVSCKKTWFISPALNANIKKVRRQADKYLANLETAGIERFDWLDCSRSNCPIEISVICRDLNLISASSISTTGAAEIRMMGTLGGGAVGQVSATRAAEREIGPNKDKLGKATTRERHLVVYVDQLNGQPWIAMTSWAPPNEAPNLPIEITHLWLIAQTGINQFVVWRATSTEPWHTVDLSAASQRYSEGEKTHA